MNVASLKLCKELYELSGWDDLETAWLETRRGNTLLGVSKDLDDANLSAVAPAYDLGYLLRKLPKFTELEQVSKQWLGRYKHEEIDTEDNYVYRHFHLYADTPEDAVAKLAIELFKQRILEREVSL